MEPPSEQEMRAIFRIFDKDNSGTISKSEIGDVMRSLGQNPTSSEIDEMIKIVDENHDGVLQYKEFVTLLTTRWNGNEQDQLRAAFAVFDVNGDNAIDRDELKKVLVSVGDEKMSNEEFDQLVDEMMSEADINRDGKIDLNEFIKVICGNR